MGTLPPRPGDAKPSRSDSPTVDWSDPVHVRALLDGLATSFEDFESVVEDMLQAPELRELGPARHRALCSAAAEQMRAALDYLRPWAAVPAPSATDAEPGDE